MFKQFAYFQEKAKRQMRWISTFTAILTGLFLIFFLPNMGKYNYIVMILSLVGAYWSYYLYSHYFKLLQVDQVEFARYLLTVEKSQLDNAKEQGLLSINDIRIARSTFIERKWDAELLQLDKKLK